MRGPDPDPVATMREFREYFASNYEANHKIAGCMGVTVKTSADWLAGDRSRPMNKLRRVCAE